LDLLRVAADSSIPPFSECAVILDGMDIKVMHVSKDVTSLFPDSWKSIKYGYENAVRFQLAVGHDMRCEWIDDGNAAGCHDLRCLWRSNFHQPFSNLNVLADNGYINSFYPVNIITGYKKPRNGELDQLQQAYNASHGTARSPVERYIGIYKCRFDMAMHGYHGPLRHFVRLVKLGIVFTNDIIRICQNHFTEAEEDIINDTIRTVVHTNPLSELLLVNNSLIETMPEVLVNQQTGEHALLWEGMEEQRRWDGRNRILQNPYPVFSGQPQQNNRGSNRIDRTIRPRPSSLNSTESPRQETRL